MCNNRQQCIYAGIINSFFEKEQSTLKQSMFYLWLLDEEGKDEKERLLQKRFDSYRTPCKEDRAGKLFFEITHQSEFGKFEKGHYINLQDIIKQEYSSRN